MARSERILNDTWDQLAQRWTQNNLAVRVSGSSPLLNQFPLVFNPTWTVTRQCDSKPFPIVNDEKISILRTITASQTDPREEIDWD